MTLADSHAGKTYRCVPGDMTLSGTMHQQLSEVFEGRRRPGKASPTHRGGRWFCPGCGCPATSDAGHVQCPQCGESLDAFLRGLVELHPHLTRLLLTVEGAIDVRGRGVVLSPSLPADEARPTPFPVEIHRPDATVRRASASAQVPFVDPTPQEQRATLTLIDVSKSEIPIGSKVWLR